MRVVIYIAVGILVLFLVRAGLQEIQKLTRKPSMPQTISMILDETDREFTKRVANVISERHSTGMRFEKISLHGHDTIRLQLEDSFMDFKNPMQIYIAHSTPYIDHFSMFLEISPRNTDTHAYAKDYMYAMVKELQAKGWTRYIYSNAPRVVANEIIAYNADPGSSDELSLSDTYEMSMEEWVSIAVFHWSFYYKNEALIHIKLRREGGANTKTTSDGYFLHIDVESPTYYIRRGFLAGDRKNWRARWKPMALGYLAARPDVEKRAMKEGFHIDKTYVDAPFARGVFPGEKDDMDDENVTCTKTGYWQSYLPDGVKVNRSIKRQGAIIYREAMTVFLEKDEELFPYNKFLKWRYLGSTDEYDLSDGKLIKKVETQEGKKVSIFCEGDVCPKNGYWEAYFYKEKGSKGVAYFREGEALSTNSNEAIAMLLKWRYLGDENDFKVTDGKLVRRT